MRLLQIVHQYPPEHVGGTELYTQSVSRCLAERGHIVAVFCPSLGPSGPSLPLQPSIENGVRVYRVPLGPRDANAVFFSAFSQSTLATAFRAAVQQEMPDLIHVQHLMGLPVSLIDQIRTAGIPFVVTLHDYWYVCANAQLLTNDRHEICGGPRGWVNCGRCALARAGQNDLMWLAPAVAPLMAYRGQLLRRVLAAARGIIAPTEFVRETYRQLSIPVDRVRVIPHGIEIPFSLPAAQPRPPGTLRIAYIGGLSWQKGVHILIEAMNQLPDQAACLSIYGDMTAFPAYVAELRQLARHPQIHFAGRLAHDDVWMALRANDVVVVPSLWYETSSLIIQEAFAAHVPVIASDLGVLRERIRDNLDGLLFASGDRAALRSALQRCVDDPVLLDRLRKGIRPVRTLQEHMTDLEAIYAEVTAPDR